jgi:hypothetical protein
VCLVSYVLSGVEDIDWFNRDLFIEFQKERKKHMVKVSSLPKLLFKVHLIT